MSDEREELKTEKVGRLHYILLAPSEKDEIVNRIVESFKHTEALLQHAKSMRELANQIRSQVYPTLNVSDIAMARMADILAELLEEFS